MARAPAKSPTVYPSSRYLRRIDDLIRASVSPFVRLSPWPAASHLIHHLGEAAWASIMLEDSTGDALSQALDTALDGMPDSKILFVVVADGRPAVPTHSALISLTTVDRLGDCRLVWLESCLRSADEVPVTTVDTGALRLRTGEAAELAGLGGEDPELHEVMSYTEGWAEPAHWLLAHSEAGTRAITGRKFQAWFAAEVLSQIDADVLAICRQIARCGGRIEVDSWRQKLIDRPTELAAFESTIWRWRLLRKTDGRWSQLSNVLRHQLLGATPPSDSGWWPPEPYSPSPDKPCVDIELFTMPRLVRANVDQDGECVISFKTQRALMAVAFLALQPRLRASREQLIEALWPGGADGELIKRNFHPTLSEARRALSAGADPQDQASPIEHQRGIYALASSWTWQIDHVQFGQHLESADRLAERVEAGEPSDDEQYAAPAFDRQILHQLSQAWRLYRGPLMAEVEAPWITGKREALRHQYLEMLRRIDRLALRIGQEDLAVDACRTLLFEEPFEERGHLRLMEHYARRGRRDLVRRQYLRLQDLLAELGLEPMADSQRRFHALMS